MFDNDLKGKNALVCGGSKGIGKSIAIEMAKMGAEVTIAARSADLLSECIRQLDDRHGQQHDFLQIDMQDHATLTSRVKNLAMVKPIHILVNNSGGPPGGPIINAQAPAFLDAFQKHLIANHLLTTLLWPQMKKVGYGRIINVISTSVKEPIAGLGVSNTTRGAVASWAKTMSKELGPHGITVNNILPGFTRTDRLDSIVQKWAAQQDISVEEMESKLYELIPLGRFADPKEVGIVAAFLASSAASYINGVSLPVDGGRLNSI